ncbi:GGDEF domain-containing protein [bacterium]|nr:GGDEF domain-containing protein [bacterium]
MSIFENAPRSARAYAKTDVMLMGIDSVSLRSIMENHAETAVLLLHQMLKVSTNRLQNTNNFVADIVRWGDEARERAIRDKVTGIYNRRYYDEVIHEEFQAAQNNGKPLSIVMVDLDRFREINDIHGHQAGDSVIKKAARIFQLALRETDILVRYGGDEFAFLMPTTDLEEAFNITERIRQIIAGSEILFDSSKPALRISVSIGIAGYPQNSTNLIELCRMADQALYRAKENGRNKVICF